MEELFGIPLTAWKIVSVGKFGFVISFNLSYYLLKTLLSAQLYSDKKEPLTDTISPTPKLTLLYSYPMKEDSPSFAISQKSKSVKVFIKSPKFEIACCVIIKGNRKN